MLKRLNAAVSTSGKLSKTRKGRGFSQKEIASAGMGLRELRYIKATFDSRRKTLHPINVQALKDTLEKRKQ